MSENLRRFQISQQRNFAPVLYERNEFLFCLLGLMF